MHMQGLCSAWLWDAGAHRLHFPGGACVSSGCAQHLGTRKENVSPCRQVTHPWAGAPTGARIASLHLVGIAPFRGRVALLLRGEGSKLYK